MRIGSHLKHLLAQYCNRCRYLKKIGDKRDRGSFQTDENSSCDDRYLGATKRDARNKPRRLCHTSLSQIESKTRFEAGSYTVSA